MKEKKKKTTHRAASRFRIPAVAALLAAAALLLYFGAGRGRFSGLSPAPENAPEERTTLNLWYTDESLSDFLAAAALDFSEEQGVRVIPRLVSGLEYLENIHEASLKTDMVPDVYILGNDSLEKAWLSGLAGKIRDEDYVCGENFPEAALSAVTCRGHLIGYPFYYETSALVYNLTYLEEAAKEQLQAEADAKAGQEAMAALEQGELPQEEGAGAEQEEASVSEAEAAERTRKLIPQTIDEILAFADGYNAPEQVQSVFSWDVSDLFYNYFFIGGHVDVGGPDGDDEGRIDLCNEDAVRCLSAYQELTQFFSIDPEAVSYEGVTQDFLDGKLVFTIATTDILSRLEEAVRDGSFPYEYGVSRVPDINEELTCRSLSVTSAVVVNGYGEKQEEANRFAPHSQDDGDLQLPGADGDRFYPSMERRRSICRAAGAFRTDPDADGGRARFGGILRAAAGGNGKPGTDDRIKSRFPGQNESSGRCRFKAASGRRQKLPPCANRLEWERREKICGV